jgi:DNA-binding NtrC family response regulator
LTTRAERTASSSLRNDQSQGYLVDKADKRLLLIVEDDPLVRMAVEDFIMDAGFDYVAASNGYKAIAALEQGASQFCGVLTDIRLGSGPDGWEVPLRARELVAKMPVVYMTGDSATHWGANGVPQSALLQKPFQFDQLGSALAMLLNDVAKGMAR